MRYCPNCGSEVNENDAFCVSCGGTLKNPEVSEPVNSDSSVFGFEDEPISSNNTYNSSTVNNNPPQDQQYQSQKTNTMCLVGFILSLFCSFIGFIVSCIGLGQVKKTNEKGKGFAVAGIIIGLLGTIIYFIVFVCRLSVALGQI